MGNGNHLYNQRVLGRWENSLNNPPEDNHYPACECCAEPIWDKLFLVDGHRYCEDCALSLHQEWLVDEESIECEGCGEMITDDCYYSVNGEAYCEECFKKYFVED